MGTFRQRDSTLLGSVSTSRYINVATSSAVAVTIQSATTAIRLYNLGTGSIIWGDSNIAVNSGNYLFPYSGVTWTDVEDVFSVYVRADSVAATLVVTEFGVP